MSQGQSAPGAGSSDPQAAARVRVAPSEVLRTNLWLVPAIEVLGAVVLFAVTYALDRAAYDGVFQVPGWAISGSARTWPGRC